MGAPHRNSIIWNRNRPRTARRKGLPGDSIPSRTAGLLWLTFTRPDAFTLAHGASTTFLQYVPFEEGPGRTEHDLCCCAKVGFNEAAFEVVTQQQGKHAVRVFTYEGNPVKQVSTQAWYKALKRAGIEAFRFHDLRHTWASWHAQNGTPLHVLQELGGWETPSMVRRYAHLASDHLAAYARKVELKTGTNPSQQHSA